MRLLIDTHIFLWWTESSDRLTGKAKNLISDPRHEIYVSVITATEIAIKQSKAKLEWSQDVLQAVEGENFKTLEFKFNHAAALRTLPFYHRDPFDRMLIVQALEEAMVLVTHDTEVCLYSPSFILV